MTLPADWTVRSPTLDDAPEILELVCASDMAAIGEPDFTTDEIYEVFNGPGHDPRKDSWLALDATGRVVGWAFVQNPTRGEREHIDVYVYPGLGEPAQGPLLDLAVDRVAQRAREAGRARITARSGVIGTEVHYVRLLEDAGFAFVKRYARMQRALTGEERAPGLPDGVTIRTVRHEDDAEMRRFYAILVAAFSELPDPYPDDYDSYRERLAAMPSITWDEWFLAEVDGVPAGALQSSDQSVEQNEGWVKSLGVTKEFRGRRLGELLLRTAFATYAGKGRRLAGLGVDMTNPTGAYRLYTTVGLRPAYEADVYEREVLASP